MKNYVTMLGVAAAVVLGAYQLVSAQQGMASGSMQQKSGTMQGSMQGGMMMPADHMAIEKALEANEIAISDAFAKGDIAKIKSLLPDEALAIDMNGPMTIGDMLKQMPTMNMKITEQKLTNFKHTWADANSVVLSYTWTGKGTMMGQPIPSPTYASSLWTKRGGKWVGVFHQETGAAPAMAMKK